MSRQFCTFYLEDMLFGIDINEIQEILRPAELMPVPLAKKVIGGLLNLRGQILLTVNLREKLGLSARAIDKKPMNVILRTPDGAVSLEVDKIGDVVEADEKRRDPVPNHLHEIVQKNLSEVYLLQDKLLLVMDTERIMDF